MLHTWELKTIAEHAAFLVRDGTYQVQGPDSVVLCDWQRAQASVKDMPCMRQLLLRDQQFKVFNPDSRHLVHGHQSPLVCVVQPFYSWVIQRQASDSCSPLFEVSMPQLQNSKISTENSVPGEAETNQARVPQEGLRTL